MAEKLKIPTFLGNGLWDAQIELEWKSKAPSSLGRLPGSYFGGKRQSLDEIEGDCGRKTENPHFPWEWPLGCQNRIGMEIYRLAESYFGGKRQSLDEIEGDCGRKTENPHFAWEWPLGCPN